MKHTVLAVCAALALASTAAFAQPFHRGPRLLDTFPSSGTTGVPVSANLMLHFNRDVHPGPGGGFDLWTFDGTMEVISNTNSSMIDFSGPDVTIHPPHGLRPHTAYYLTWPQGAVVDSSGNPDEGNGSDTTFRFKTGP